MCIRDRPEILPEHLRVRVHIAGLKIYESVADIVTALKQVGQLVEIDRQRTEHSLFGVINRHIERLRTRLRDRRPVHSDRHDPIERGSRSPQLTAGDTLRSPGPYASDWARFAGNALSPRRSHQPANRAQSLAYGPGLLSVSPAVNWGDLEPRSMGSCLSLWTGRRSRTLVRSLSMWRLMTPNRLCSVRCRSISTSWPTCLRAVTMSATDS